MAEKKDDRIPTAEEREKERLKKNPGRLDSNDLPADPTAPSSRVVAPNFAAPIPDSDLALDGTVTAEQVYGTDADGKRYDDVRLGKKDPQEKKNTSNS